MNTPYLPPGLSKPAASPDGLDAPFWEGVRDEILRIQRCDDCGQWQWGPEWICHGCAGFNLKFEDVEPTGLIYSYERVWHPVHKALNGHGPYIVVLVELPQAGNVRMVGNLLGDPEQIAPIGAAVRAVFEHHFDEDAPFSLVQWKLTD
jgi:uncharacterized OB-fold protein